jgi:hypothetical protein
VLSDANLLQLTDILDRPLSLYEYRNSLYPGLVTDAIPDATVRQMITSQMRTHLTSLQDANALRHLSLAAARQDVAVRAVYARDYRPSHAAENLILLAHRKANPWVELYEDRLNFRYDWVSGSRIARIVNRAPRNGEQASYDVVWAQRGYGLIAHLRPGPENCSVLILAGTDLMSIEAAARTVSDETAMARLLEQLGIAAADPIPPFEALLETKLLTNTPTAMKLVAHRTSGDTRLQQ